MGIETKQAKRQQIPQRCPGCHNWRPLTGGRGCYVNLVTRQIVEVALCEVCGRSMDTQIGAEKVRSNVKNYFRSGLQEK